MNARVAPAGDTARQFVFDKLIGDPSPAALAALPFVMWVRSNADAPPCPACGVSFQVMQGYFIE